MIVLVGFMGAGKSTVGRLLASELGLPFADTDALVAARGGRSVPSIFESAGEAGFRDLEREVVADVLDGPEAVVALGGGALGDPRTCTDLEWATVVHLEVTFAEAMRRLQGEPGRPMLKIADPKALLAEREETYRRVADVSVATDGLSPEMVAKEIVARVGGSSRGRPGVARVAVPVAERGYEVLVGRGLCEVADELLPDLPDAERALVVTQAPLEDRAGGLVAALRRRGLEVAVETVPDGEDAKTLAVAGSLYDALARLGFHRHDLVVAFGGGAVCDVAGFVASTFKRGIPLVNVATTLLAQVDAAIGGKTGVNLEHAKNLVGTFHQPRAVLCDVALLEGLPDEELIAGLAEVAKCGFISDRALLEVLTKKQVEVLARDTDVLVDIVLRCAAVKAALVAVDERDEDRRALLNYGHTFGHAIEKLHGFRGIRHGEAVSLGMMAAAHLSVVLRIAPDELPRTHRDVLEGVGLPVAARLDFDALQEAWQHDKKYRHGVRFVLLEDLGRPRLGVVAPEDAVRDAVERLAR